MGLWCGGPVRAMIALGVYQLALGYYGVMKALVPIVLALAVALGVAVYMRTAPGGRVYSYPALIDQLQRHPGDWLGHTLRVRAQVEDTSHIPGPDARLYDPDSALMRIALHTHPISPFISLIRRAPEIGRLIPGLPQLNLDRPAVYRIRIERGQGWDCLFMPSPCFSAELLDFYQYPG
jgi:hypothetical protein